MVTIANKRARCIYPRIGNFLLTNGKNIDLKAFIVLSVRTLELVGSIGSGSAAGTPHEGQSTSP